jgi:RNA recognition motif-containing protein
VNLFPASDLPLADFLQTQSLIDNYLNETLRRKSQLPVQRTRSGRTFFTIWNVSSVNVISDKFTGRSKGFAFIEFENDDEANRAIEDLHETEFMQRNLIVNEARPREDRPQRSFDRNRGGGGGGGDRDRGGYRR